MKHVPFQAILDRILVKRLPRPQNRVIGVGLGGQELVQTQQDSKAYDRGVVVSVGQGVPMSGVLLPIPYEIGDVVILGEYGGEQVYLDPEDEFKKGMPEYLVYRVADTKGKDLR